MPLYDAHRAFVLRSRIVHADETPISLLDPGAGKTKKAYMWAYARGVYEAAGDAPGAIQTIVGAAASVAQTGAHARA